MATFWDTSGALLKHFWNTSGIFLKHFCDTSGTLCEHLWDIFGTLLGHWDTFGTLLHTPASAYTRTLSRHFGDTSETIGRQLRNTISLLPSLFVALSRVLCARGTDAWWYIPYHAVVRTIALNGQACKRSFGLN